MGDYEAASLGVVESTLKYHPLFIWVLIPSGGQCLVGSLAGVVASKSVAEASKGTLSMYGNHAQSVMTQGCLTVRLTSRPGTKVGHSDPVVPYGRAIAQRIKGTPGITG